MKRKWLVALAFGCVAAVVYFASMANYAFPGESAHLQALWRGLDFAADCPYPLMAMFAKLLGSGNLLAPVCGVLATVLLFFLVDFFVRARVYGENTVAKVDGISLVAASVASAVFMFSPAVRESATHLEPRLFDATWAMLLFALTIPFLRIESALSLVCPVLMGALAAFGFCDSALFIALMPGMLAAIVAVQLKRNRKPYLALTLFVFSFLIVFVFARKGFGLELADFLRKSSKELKAYYTSPGWLFVAIFSTLPFVTTLFSSGKAYNEAPSLVQWLFHSALSFVSIIAVATPLAPSALMEPYGVLPVVTCAFAAVVAGHLVSYWWIHRNLMIAKVAGGILVFVLIVTCGWNLFVFDGSRGAFADKVARKVIADLDTRTWLVTDGSLDDHLLLAAAEAGKELNLIQLSRDLDTTYLEHLSKVVREKNVGGSKNESLSLSLSLGVLPFVQDWFAADPSVAKDVAIFGAPDLWYSADLKPVPEFLFFGADPKRSPDWGAWKEFDTLLSAPKGWGSYRLPETRNPVDRMRLSLRRHLGLVANNRGVYLQDEKKDDEAFAMYELVLNEIDRDNVCSLFNEIEMAGAKHPKAVAKKRDLERQLKMIVDDKERRYVIWRLGYYYGYIRNPDMFIRLGFAWARSGRPGDALSQIKRAIDFVPTDKRTVLLNMMAALYANENDSKKSRKIYEAILNQNANDHDALVGMMRLELLNGDSAKALSYLQRAAQASGDKTRAQIEYAMVQMMRNDFESARDALKKVTDADAKNLQAWSLMAAVTMQLCDATKDEKRRKALEKELSNSILPVMERISNNPYDYYVQTTKAFLLLRQGEDKRKEARDAFATAAKSRPDIQATQDLVLGLDISLDDKVEAERHAREVLRRNRDAPLANYVMGSLALGKNEYREAEAFLRRAVNTPKPNVLALNDLAEVLRRNKAYAEAERYARQAVQVSPNLYVAWETLGAVIMDAKGNLDEAEKCVRKACDLSRKNGKEEDVRMLISLGRVQLLKGDKHAKGTFRKVQGRIDELSEFEKKEFEELRKGVH